MWSVCRAEREVALQGHSGENMRLEEFCSSVSWTPASMFLHTADPAGLTSPRQECISQYLISLCSLLLEPEKVATEQENGERQVIQRLGISLGTLKLRGVTHPMPATARSIKTVARITTHL